MPRANVPLTQLAIGGDDVDVGETTFDGSDDAMFANPDAKTILVLQNDGAGTHIVTFTTPAVAPGALAIADPTVTLLTGEKHVLSGFDPATFNQQSGADIGKVYMQSDGTKTDMKAKAYRV